MCVFYELRISAKKSAVTRDRSGDLTIFSRTLSQLSYNGGLPSSEHLAPKTLSRARFFRQVTKSAHQAQLRSKF